MEKVIVIGGGIGIPPMLLTAKSIDSDVEIVLGYSNGDLFLEDEFAFRDDLVFPAVNGSVLGSREDDFHQFKVHEVEDRPNVPTHGHTLGSVIVDGP